MRVLALSILFISLTSHSALHKGVRILTFVSDELRTRLDGLPEPEIPLRGELQELLGPEALDEAIELLNQFAENKSIEASASIDDVLKVEDWETTRALFHPAFYEAVWLRLRLGEENFRLVYELREYFLEHEGFTGLKSEQSLFSALARATESRSLREIVLNLNELEYYNDPRFIHWLSLRTELEPHDCDFIVEFEEFFREHQQLPKMAPTVEGDNERSLAERLHKRRKKGQLTQIIKAIEKAPAPLDSDFMAILKRYDRIGGIDTLYVEELVAFFENHKRIPKVRGPTEAERRLADRTNRRALGDGLTRISDELSPELREAMKHLFERRRPKQKRANPKSPKPVKRPKSKSRN